MLALVEQADALIEGFRPGVAERLGIGPDDCLARNPKLVYGRMTGWGQDGPYAQAAGHDINYIALGGALAHFGRAGTKPTPPINIVGDFGGGGMLMAFGVACALVEAGRSGQGQVVDAAMVDGSAILMTMIWGFQRARHLGSLRHQRARHRRAVLRHVRDVGRQVHLARLARAAVLRRAARPARARRRGRPRRARWTSRRGPSCASKLTALFKTKTRDEWCEILEHTDACFAPVLTMPEAAEHPHMQARGTIVERGRHRSSPRRRRGSAARRARSQRPPAWPGQHTDEVLADWGFSADRIAKLREAGAIK